MDNVDLVLGIGVGAVFYFLPALVAYYRGHNNRLAIAVCNILLGWTVLGWVVSIIWASTSNVESG
jgi:hypothetical protein